MANEILSEFYIPEAWEEMTIKAISKNKGDQKSMNSKRGLFLTNIASKVIEKLLKNRGKEEIEKNVTEFQCGGASGRSIGDNLLILNSAIAEFKERREDIYIATSK